MLRSLDGEPTFLTSPGVSAAALARKKAAPRQLAGQGASFAASRLASDRFWRSCGTVARLRRGLSSNAASRLEGSGSSADFCGVFGRISLQRRLHLELPVGGGGLFGWSLRFFALQRLMCSLQPTAASGRHSSPGGGSNCCSFFFADVQPVEM